MTNQRIILTVAARFTGCGLLAGLIGGILVMFISITLIELRELETLRDASLTTVGDILLSTLVFGIIAGVIGAMTGAVLGVVIGIVSGIVTAYLFNPPQDRVLYHVVLGGIAAFITLGGSFGVFYVLFGQQDSAYVESMGGSSWIAAFLALNASQLIAYWHLRDVERTSQVRPSQPKGAPGHVLVGTAIGAAVGLLIGLLHAADIYVTTLLYAPPSPPMQLTVADTAQRVLFAILLFIAPPVIGGGILGTLGGVIYGWGWRRVLSRV